MLPNHALMTTSKPFTGTMGAAGRVLRGLALLGLSLGLVACASKVKLDETPATAAPAQAAPSAAAAAPIMPNPPAPAVGAPVKDSSVGAMSNLPQTPVAAADVATPKAADPRAAQPTAAQRVVYFEFDSAVVREEFRPALEAHAQYLKQDSRRQLALEGHADDRGSREYNLALGQRRSDAVRRVLSLLGVQESQMEAVSFGEEKPAVNGNDEAAYSQNRRVELRGR